MAHQRHVRVAAILVLAASLLALLARSMEWHRRGQTGFTVIPDSVSVLLIIMSVTAAAGACLVLARPRVSPLGLGYAACALAATVLTLLLELGDGSYSPTRGAWIAGGAVTLLVIASGLLVSRSRRVHVAVIVFALVLAAGAVVLPTRHPFQSPEVIR